MTKEQVQALRSAGISETAIIDRILQETADAVAPKGSAAPEPKDAPEPEKTPEPEKKTEPAEKPSEQGPDPDKTPAPQEDKILAAIERLTGAVLNHNVLGTGSDSLQEESAEALIGKALRNS